MIIHGGGNRRRIGRRFAIKIRDGFGDFRCGRRRQFVGNRCGQAFFASATPAATTTAATAARTALAAFALLLVLRRGLAFAIGILTAVADHVSNLRGIVDVEGRRRGFVVVLRALLIAGVATTTTTAATTTLAIARRLTIVGIAAFARRLLVGEAFGFLGFDLGLDVERGRPQVDAVAEGVEEPEQASRLVELGCAMGQGHLLARPLTASAADDVWAVSALSLTRSP